MKYLLFAGGGGTRFWPISRKSLPKQFAKIFDGKSSFQLAVDRCKQNVDLKDVYVCTRERYIDFVKEQAPDILGENIFLETHKRDIAPALGMTLMRLRKSGYSGSVAVMWADHVIPDAKAFMDAFIRAERILDDSAVNLVMMGLKPKFANNNFGWINFDRKIETDQERVYGLKGFIYKPPILKCERIFRSGNWLWNIGYYVSTVEYILGILEEHNPELYKALSEIEKVLGEKDELDKIANIYEKIKPISSDNAIIYNVPKNEVRVLEADFEWDDPGTLHAYKRFRVGVEANYIHGEGKFYKSEDSMIYNTTDHKVVCLGLEGVSVVHTEDVTYVVYKDAVVETSNMLKELEKDSEYKGLL
ncbi:hypothetical protein GF357_02445 [Candidatus Dojkabacteria bacterium]|nr:hypothetical protein [Candidatus Dojkabacteria bacterium]